jgi:hypothetical protein
LDGGGTVAAIGYEQEEVIYLMLGERGRAANAQRLAAFVPLAHTWTFCWKNQRPFAPSPPTAPVDTTDVPG